MMLVEYLIVLVNQVAEVDHVEILGQQMQHEPVTDISLANDAVQSVPVDDIAARIGEHEADGSRHNCNDAEDECKESDNGQQIKPKPKENIDLFVDDIDRQKTHSVVSDDVTY